MESFFFEEGGIGIRPVEDRDLAKIAALRNDQDTWTWLGDPRPVFEEDQVRWFASLAARSGRYYFVVAQRDRSFIGLVRMDEHDHINRSIRVGADVLPELRGQGFGKAIFRLIKRYCFGYLGVHRVWLLVLESNERAKKLYLGQGFKEEGRLRDAIYRNGKFMDYISMSILEKEWNGG